MPHTLHLHIYFCPDDDFGDHLHVDDDFGYMEHLAHCEHDEEFHNHSCIHYDNINVGTVLDRYLNTITLTWTGLPFHPPV